MITPAIIAQAETMSKRADRIHGMICDRAKRQWDMAFNDGNPSEFYTFFHYAHNWQNLPSLTQMQRHACKLVLHMERKSWEPSRIVSRWYARVTQ